MKVYRRPFFHITAGMLLSGICRTFLFYAPSLFFIIPLSRTDKASAETASTWALILTLILILLTNARYRLELEGSELRYYKRRKLLGTYNLNPRGVGASIGTKYNITYRVNSETGERTRLSSDKSAVQDFYLHIKEPGKERININCDFLGDKRFKALCDDIGLVSENYY